VVQNANFREAMGDGQVAKNFEEGNPEMDPGKTKRLLRRTDEIS
jgi:hypothetical protein